MYLAPTVTYDPRREMDEEHSTRGEEPQKTRILIAYKEFPALSVGHAGGQGVFRLIQALHRRGYSVVLVARLRREEAALVEETRPFCERIVTVPHHQALSGPLPLRIARSYLALRQAVARTLRETRPDLMLVEFTQTALVLLGLRRPFTALRPHDVNWFLLEQRARYQRGLRRLGTLSLAWLFGRLEPWLLRRYDQILAISEGDRRLVMLKCRPVPTLLLPLAPALSAGAPSRPAVPPGPHDLFVGAVDRRPRLGAAGTGGGWWRGGGSRASGRWGAGRRWRCRRAPAASGSSSPATPTT